MSGLGEALSAPGSIAGLVSLGIDVAKALYSVADGIAAAGEEVRNVALEVDMYTQTMEAIQDVIERQETVSSNILALIDRLVGICLPIFNMYKDMQKRLLPLIESFGESKRKLEQVNLRLSWYFKTKSKVLGYRNALKRQFSLLTPILTVLGIDQRCSSTQIHNHIHNHQVNIVLQSSIENVRILHNSNNSDSLQCYQAEDAEELFPPPIGSSRFIGGGSAESFRRYMASGVNSQEAVDIYPRQASPTADATSSSALVCYQPPGNDDIEILSTAEAVAVDRDVELVLDQFLDDLSYDNVREIVLATYSTERQFLHLMAQFQYGTSTGGRHASNSTRASPNLTDYGNNNLHTSSSPHFAGSYAEEEWITIIFPNRSSFRFPLDEIQTEEGLYGALVCAGFKTVYWSGHSRIWLDDGDIDDLLSINKVHIVDSKGKVILPQLWSRFIKPGMTVRLKKGSPDNLALNLGHRASTRGFISKMLKKLR